MKFILGGARSGKSRHAMLLAERMTSHPVLIATAIAGDEEMQRRIARHRSERGAHWTTVEAPLGVGEAIAKFSAGETTVVDCLTFWLFNTMQEQKHLESEVARLIDAIEKSPANLILVSNEVGLGVVPATTIGRDFRDEQGRLNQRLAEIADQVIFLAAGLPLTLKPER